MVCDAEAGFECPVDIDSRRIDGGRSGREIGAVPASMERRLRTLPDADMTLPSDLLGTIYLVIALSGVVVAVLGWRGGRPGRRRWCPQCGYDLSDTDSRTCPECGFSSIDEADFRRRRRRWWVLITGLSIVAIASGFAVGTGVAGATTRLLGPAWSLLESRSVAGGWTVDHEISADLDRTVFNRRIRVTRDGAVHFQWSGWSSMLGYRAPGSGRVEGLGTDVDRDGEPDLVIQVSDGGNASPSTWFVLSLASRSAGARIEPAAVLFDGWFEDVDGDDRPEFIATDSTLRDAWSEYRGLAIPDVVLSPRQDEWRFDRALTVGRSLPEEWSAGPDAVLAEARAAWASEARPFVSRLFSLATVLAARSRGDEAIALMRAPWPGDDDPSSVAEFTTLIDEESQLPRRYRPDPAAREADFRDLMDRWRWNDRLPLPSP